MNHSCIKIAAFFTVVFVALLCLCLRPNTVVSKAKSSQSLYSNYAQDDQTSRLLPLITQSYDATKDQSQHHVISLPLSSASLSAKTKTTAPAINRVGRPQSDTRPSSSVATTVTLLPNRRTAEAPFPACWICGEGMKVTENNEDVTLPTEPPITLTCEDLEETGLQGYIETNSCGIVIDFISACSCAPVTTFLDTVLLMPFTIVLHSGSITDEQKNGLLVQTEQFLLTWYAASASSCGGGAVPSDVAIQVADDGPGSGDTQIHLKGSLMFSETPNSSDAAALQREALASPSYVRLINSMVVDIGTVDVVMPPLTNPSPVPVASPSRIPTLGPSVAPSMTSSSKPSFKPSAGPTSSPSTNPTPLDDECGAETGTSNASPQTTDGSFNIEGAVVCHQFTGFPVSECRNDFANIDETQEEMMSILFLESYNIVAEPYCRSFTESSITSTDVDAFPSVAPSFSPAPTTSAAPSSSTLAPTFSNGSGEPLSFHFGFKYEIKGTCRFCAPNSANFLNDGIRRVLQEDSEGEQCECGAPSVQDFLTEYNQALGILFQFEKFEIEFSEINDA